jgi:MscS family membrane protein
MIRKITFWHQLIPFSLLLLFSVQLLEAQTQRAPEVTLESPNNTMWVHLYYLQADTYEPAKAARVIPPGTDSVEAVNMARELKQILDGKGLFVRLNEIPVDSNYMDSVSRQHIYTPFPSALPGVYLERIDGKWYYSPETINNLDRIHDEIYPWGTEYLLDIAPQWSMQKFLGLKLWQWIGILTFILIGYLLHLLLKMIIKPILGRYIVKRLQLVDLDQKLQRRLAQVVSLLLIFLLFRRLYPALQLPVEWASTFRMVLAIFIAVLFAILLYRIFKVLVVYLESAAAKTESKMDDQVLPIIERGATILIIIGAVFYILSVVGVNVAALIAGLSIGGIALALAAQDTVKNLIGSVMIFMDKPFQVGDFVLVDGEYGTVTEVGFRSTRIMLKDTSIIAIPNGQVANMTIRNLGIRFYRILDTEISLTYDTPPYLIEQFVEGVRKILQMHPMTVKEDQYVYFSRMADSSLNVMVRTHIRTQLWDEELNVKQDLFLDIMRMAKGMGIRFAFPSRTLYIEDFPEKESLIPGYEEGEAGSREVRDKYLQQLQEKYEQMKNDDEEDDWS